MTLRDFFAQCAKTLKIANKPGRGELWLSIKICLLGIAAIGVIGYIIKVISAVLNPGGSVATSS